MIHVAESKAPAPIDPADFDAWFAQPKAFTLPYKWGQFAVSRLAAPAYGLVPRPGDRPGDIVPGDETPPPLGEKAVDVMVVAPSEFTMPPLAAGEPLSLGTDTRGVVLPGFTRTGTLRLLVGFGNTLDELKEVQLKKYADALDVPADVIREGYTTDAGVPAMEHIAGEMSQALVHGIVATLEPALMKYLPEQRPSRIMKALHPVGYYMGVTIAAREIVDDVHQAFHPVRTSPAGINLPVTQHP